MAEKCRNWGTIVYPESCAEDWKERLENLHMPILISPLHDKDVDKNGELKKPHYHVLLMFDGPTTRANVKKLVDTIKGVGAEEIMSRAGNARYLCHLDSPEKVQYPVDGVTAFCCNYDDLAVKNEDDKKDGVIEMVGQMLEWCEQNNCDSFYRLVKTARADGRKDWLKALITNSAVQSLVYRCLRSMEYDNHREDNQRVAVRG